MKKPNHSKVFIILAIVMLLSSVLACSGDERENITTTFEQYYSIDPKSLLDSISQDGKDSFRPVETEPEFPPPAQQMPVNWSQADYIRIVESIYRNVWGETVDGWSLKSMSFASNCTKIDYGFQNAHFRYFKNTSVQESEVRIERSIHVDPRSKSTYVLEFEYFPRLTDWSSIDLAQIRYSADDALMTAENNGGKEKRLAAEDVCDITLLLSPDAPRYRGWDVRYTNSDGGTIFHVEIKPLTGEIHFP